MANSSLQPLLGDPSSSKPRIESLDLLRLIAALAVVVFHYSFRGASSDGYSTVHVATWSPVTKYGFLGVDLFFVISGFVIVWTAEGRTAIDFAVARASRIYPGFLVCMSVSFLVCLVMGGPRFAVTVQQWVANLFVCAPIFRQPFMDGTYWSIVYELTFYGWITILLAAGLFWRRFDTIIVVWLLLSLCNEHFLDSHAVRNLFVTDKSGLFAAGMMLYALRGGRKGLGAQLLLLGSILAAIDQASLGTEWLRDHYHSTFSNLTIALTTVGCVAAVTIAMRISRVPLPRNVVLALGGLTYPLYLVHQHVGYILLTTFNGVVPPSILVLATAALMLAVAFLIWRFVERPGIRLCKSLLTWFVVAGRELAHRLPSVPFARSAVAK